MDLKNIHTIFKDRILRIPSYQRGYSWANNKPIDIESNEPLKNVKGQLKDLWDDIMNIPEDGWHYTGLLTMVKTNELTYKWLPTYEQYSIVDGQQRITSILILLSIVIKKANKMNLTLGIRPGDAEFQYLLIKQNGENAYIFGYEEDNPSDKYFRKHILELDEIEDESKESVYTENLLKAKLFFEGVVTLYLNAGNGSRGERLKKLYSTITVKLRLNEYILPEELDEYVVFETMNNRGKPLSQLERLKNRLMYLNDKFDTVVKVDDAEESIESVELRKARKITLHNKINKAWITIYKSLGRNKSAPLNDEDFIKNHWIVYFDNYHRSASNVYANFLFDDYFNLQKIYSKDLTSELTKDYVKSLQKSSVWWDKLHNINHFEESEGVLKNTILGVHRVGLKSSFRPLLLAILTREDRGDFIKVIELLEQYSFKIFDVSDRKSNTGDSKIYSLANQVYRLKVDASQTENEIHSYTNDYYWFGLFENQCTELFTTGYKQGFYKWSGIFYFLFEYDQKLRRDNRNTTASSEILWQDFRNKKTIEHIYPQSAIQSLKEYASAKGKSENEVKYQYEKIQNNWPAFKDYSREERSRLAHSLGNLLAMSNGDNASAGNAPYIFKVDQSNKGETYKNRGYKFDSMSAMTIATQYLEWTPTSILNRGLNMLKFLCDYIGEDFNAINTERKYKLLGLEFMLKDEPESVQADLSVVKSQN